MDFWTEDAWRERRAAHEARVEPWVRPHLERRRRGEPHPVHDFLFTYYSQRPAALLRWHPGYGAALPPAAAQEVAGLKGYRTVSDDGHVAVTDEHVASQRVLLETLRRLLAATASRPAMLGCFGMHEWAMVYRLDQDEVRHSAWPLRLGTAGTDTVVESHRITCSHFDAFRFFTDDARPRNTLQPASHDRADFEQPGCLHAGMDLYKHAFRLSPMICSDLVADAFDLAWDIRVMDMRAAPYDLSGVVLDRTGEQWSPIRVETAAGKREYADLQAEHAERGAPIRARLLAEVERLLGAVA